ncbi:unnamed protein product [Amoebophrya sp. A25]|nr:unnamed protein product [Amoebophrya sp. A25]|eukprot:GSA25T00002156001.1
MLLSSYLLFLAVSPVVHSRTPPPEFFGSNLPYPSGSVRTSPSSWSSAPRQPLSSGKPGSVEVKPAAWLGHTPGSLGLSKQAMADDANPPYYDMFDEISRFLYLPELKLLNNVVTVSVAPADSYVKIAPSTAGEQPSTTGINATSTSGGTVTYEKRNYAGFTEDKRSATGRAALSGPEHSGPHFAFRSAFQVQIGFYSWRELFREINSIIALDDMGDHFAELGDRASALWEKFEDQVEVLDDNVEDQMEAAGEAIEDAAEAVADKVQNAAEAVTDALGGIADTLEEKVDDLQEGAGEAWEWDTVKDKLDDTKEKVEGVVENVQGWAADHLRLPWSSSGSSSAAVYREVNIEDDKDKEEAEKSVTIEAASTGANGGVVALGGDEPSSVQNGANAASAESTVDALPADKCRNCGAQPFTLLEGGKYCMYCGVFAGNLHEFWREGGPGGASRSGLIGGRGLRSGASSNSAFAGASKAGGNATTPTTTTDQSTLSRSFQYQRAFLQRKDYNIYSSFVAVGPDGHLPGAKSTARSRAIGPLFPGAGSSRPRSTGAAREAAIRAQENARHKAARKTSSMQDSQVDEIRGLKLTEKKKEAEQEKALRFYRQFQAQEEVASRDFQLAFATSGSSSSPLAGGNETMSSSVPVAVTGETSGTEQGQSDAVAAEAVLDFLPRQWLQMPAEAMKHTFEVFFVVNARLYPEGDSDPETNASLSAAIAQAAASQEKEGGDPEVTSGGGGAFLAPTSAASATSPACPSATDVGASGPGPKPMELFLEVSSFKVNDVLLDDHVWLRPIWKLIYPKIDQQLSKAAQTALNKWMAENTMTSAVLSRMLKYLGLACACCGKKS